MTGKNRSFNSDSGPPRKRRMDLSARAASVASDPDVTTSGGDSHKSPLTSMPLEKIQRLEEPTPSIEARGTTGRPSYLEYDLQQVGSTLHFRHNFVAQIRDTKLFEAGNLKDYLGQSRSAHRIGHDSQESGQAFSNLIRKPSPINTNEVCISCQLDDQWIDQYDRSYRKRPREKVTTGEPYADTILPHLELQGYCMLGRLGQGRFASVLLTRSRLHHRVVAIKFLVRGMRKKTPRKSSGIVTLPWTVEPPDEITIHEKLKHKNVVEMLDYHLINGKFCLVLEMCENGDLASMLEQRPKGIITEAIARKYFRQMLSGLEYLHTTAAIVHRDLKCKDLLIDDANQVKISDFGSARSFRPGDPMFTDCSGTAGYQAPEVMTGMEYDPILVDLFALGVILHIMLVGHLPFGSDPLQFLTETRKVLNFDKYAVSLSPEVKALVSGLLNHVTSCRWSLNRTKFWDWLTEMDQTVFIGNYHFVRQPQKFQDGERERILKSSLNI